MPEAVCIVVVVDVFFLFLRIPKAGRIEHFQRKEIKTKLITAHTKICLPALILTNVCCHFEGWKNIPFTFFVEVCRRYPTDGGLMIL
jgi:hypothetical protein